MRTFNELEELFQAIPPRPRGVGTLRLIVVRVDEGVHTTPSGARLDVHEGLEGDRWARKPDRDLEAQVTLMDERVADLVGAGTLPLQTAGDNLIIDLDLTGLTAGDRVRVGEAVIEVTAKPHAGCYKFAGRFGQEALRWVNWREHRARRLRGLHGRILQGGSIAVGDPVEILVNS